jgi:hypothetical protein
MRGGDAGAQCFGLNLRDACSPAASSARNQAIAMSILFGSGVARRKVWKRSAAPGGIRAAELIGSFAGEKASPPSAGARLRSLEAVVRLGSGSRGGEGRSATSALIGSRCQTRQANHRGRCVSRLPALSSQNERSVAWIRLLSQAKFRSPENAPVASTLALHHQVQRADTGHNRIRPQNHC